MQPTPMAPAWAISKAPAAPFVGAGAVIGLATGDRIKAMQAMKRIMGRFGERNSTVVPPSEGCGYRRSATATTVWPTQPNFLKRSLRPSLSRRRRIAVIAAMDKEVNLPSCLLGTDAAESVAGRVKIITGRLGDADIAIAKSGIGKVNAAPPPATSSTISTPMPL